MLLNQEHFSSRLDAIAPQLDIDLSAKQVEQLFAYFTLFNKWNQTFNLSAIRDIEQILVKHLADSLSIVPVLAATEYQNIIDVGTGGGLPGIVLAVCFPERQFTLLDSAGKKMRFLFQVKQELALTNVELQDCRVESFQPRDGFDVVCSRAFSSISNMLEWCAHLPKPSGEFWAMKGKYPEQELSEIPKHYIVVEHCELVVPDLHEERCLIKIRRSTP